MYDNNILIYPSQQVYMYGGLVVICTGYMYVAALYGTCVPVAMVWPRTH
jgi:hypothetical protein